MKTLHSHWLAALHEQSRDQLAAHGYLSVSTALKLTGHTGTTSASATPTRVAAPMFQRAASPAVASCCPAR